MRQRRGYLVVLSAACAGVLLTALGSPAAAQWPGDRDRDGSAYRYGVRDGGIGDVVRRVEDRSDRFRKLVDKALDDSFWNRTRREDRINARVKDMDDAIDRFRKLYERRRSPRLLRGEFENVLRHANVVDRMMQAPRIPARIREPWREIRSDLNRIADAYDLRPIGYALHRGWRTVDERRDGDRGDRRDDDRDGRRDDDRRDRDDRPR